MAAKWIIGGVVLVGILTTAGSLRADDTPVLRIGRDAGNMIVTCPDDPKNITAYNRRFAALELADYLERITGAKIPVTDTVEAKKIETGGVIFVGPSKYTDALGISRERTDFGPGGYLIKTTGRNIVILGDDTETGVGKMDTPGGGGDAGTYYGTSAFLEKFGGVRWLWPGELGTVVPKRKMLSIPRVEIHAQPAYLQRAFTYPVEVAMRLPNGSWETGEQLRLWVLFHRRHGGGSSTTGLGGAGHYLDTYVKRDDFKDHPEYFAFYDGKRQSWPADPNLSGQVCYSNPDVVRLFADTIVKNCPPAGGGFSLCPNDGYGFCMCDKCKAMDKGSKPWPAGSAGWGEIPGAFYNEKFGAAYDISNRIWTFNNEIARQVAQRAPLARLGAYAYSCYVLPPENIRHIEDNIHVIICDWLVTSGDSSQFEKGWEIFDKWSERSGHLGLYGYYFGQTCRPHHFAECLRKLHNMNVISIYGQTSQAWANRWSEYVIGLKALWDPNLDTDAVLDDYLSAGFGPGRTALRKYLDRYERASLLDAPSSAIPNRKVWTPAVRAELRQYLDEALRATKGTEYEARVRFVEEGWELVDSVAGMGEALADLKGMGLGISGIDAGDVNPVNASPEEVKTGIMEARKCYDRLSAAMTKVEEKKGFSIPWFSRNLLAGAWSGVSSWAKEVDGFYVSLVEGSALALPIEWRFRIDPAQEGEKAGWYKQDLNDTGWVNIRTDACWEKQGFGQKEFPANGFEGYNGHAWYRVKVNIPEARRGQNVRLELGAVDESFTAWVNGQKCATFDFNKQPDQDAWQKPQVFDITAAVRYGEENLIAVEVVDRVGAGGIWKQCFLLFPEKKTP